MEIIHRIEDLKRWSPKVRQSYNWKDERLSISMHTGIVKSNRINTPKAFSIYKYFELLFYRGMASWAFEVFTTLLNTKFQLFIQLPNLRL